MAFFLLALTSAGCSGKVSGVGLDGGSGGSGGNTPPATCAEACAHLLQVPCPQGFRTSADCESGCNQAQASAQASGCTSEFDAFLDCIDRASLNCDANGNIDPSACQSSAVPLARCERPPPAGCEAIPYPGTSTPCSRGGSSGGGFMTTCTDPNGHTWTATCNGSRCSCGYDGTTVCSCATDGGAVRSCCPGA